MIKNKLDYSGALKQSSFSTWRPNARADGTYRCPKVPFREPDIPPEPQPRQALISVHLEDFALILRGRMPKDVVLNQHENSRTYGAGFQL